MPNTDFPIVIGTLSNFNCNRNIYDTAGISPTLTAGMGMGGGCVPMIIQPVELECVGNMEGYEITNRVYSENGISPALRASGGAI